MMAASTAVRVGRCSARFWTQEASKLLHVWLEPASPEKADEELREEVLDAAEKFNEETSHEIAEGIRHIRLYTGGEAPPDDPSGV